MSVNNSLLKSMQTIVDKSIEIAPFDKTRQAQVVTNNADGTYAIRLDGVLYSNVISYPYTDVLNVGDVVKVCIPSNQTNHMYIKSSQGDKAYVKKSGDTMTGTLTLPKLDIIGANNRVFSFKKTIDDTNLDIGWDYSNGDGSGVALRSADAGGGFVLYARNNTTAEYSLAGKTDGTLTWNNKIRFNSTGNISYIGSLATSEIIKFIDNTSDAYGNGISIGGGGIVIVGAGESQNAVASGKSAGSEVLYLSADENVDILANCQNGTADAKVTRFRTDGYLDVMQGGIYLNGTCRNWTESPYYATMPRKKAGSGGWAMTAYGVLDAAGSDFAHFGVFGSANTFSYIYIGTGAYSATTALRVNANGSCTAASWGTYSDRRFKEDIAEIEKADTILFNLNPIEFKWSNESRDGKTHYGFIAQEVKEILEQAEIDTEKNGLIDEDSEGYLSINYVEFIPMLVHLCQSQQKEIDELKEKIGELL